MTQITDISSYLVLIREFNIFKTKLLDNTKGNYIEKNSKINVGSHNFIKDIDQSLSRKNFDIFSKNNNLIK